MKKWIITWDIGYGECAEIVEAETVDQATMMAYDKAREEFEHSAEYGAEPYSKELAEAHDIE